MPQLLGPFRDGSMRHSVPETLVLCLLGRTLSAGLPPRDTVFVLSGGDTHPDLGTDDRATPRSSPPRDFGRRSPRRGGGARPEVFGQERVSSCDSPPRFQRHSSPRRGGGVTLPRPRDEPTVPPRRSDNDGGDYEWRGNPHRTVSIVRRPLVAGWSEPAGRHLSSSSSAGSCVSGKRVGARRRQDGFAHPAGSP